MHMLTKFRRELAGVALVVLMGISTLTPSFADNAWNNMNPYLRDAAIGAAVGVGVNAVGGGDISLGKAAVMGGLTQVGAGAVDRSNRLADNPLVRRTVKGGIYGLGTSTVLDRGRVQGALVGAGAGAGYHYLKQGLNRNRFSDYF